MDFNFNAEMNRRNFLKASALAAVATALATAAPRLAFAQSPAQDLEILNYALTLEHLETAAYKAINASGLLSGDAAKYFIEFGGHEATHVDALTSTITKLGGTPVAAQASYNFPKFGSQDEVLKYFQGVEELGAAAYLGQAPRIQNKDILTAAISIHNVEAQHASVLADLINLNPPSPKFGTPKDMAAVLAVVGPLLGGGNAPATAPANNPQTMPTTGAAIDTGLLTVEAVAGGLALLGGGWLLRRTKQAQAIDTTKE